MDTPVTVDVLANDTDADGNIDVAATVILTPPANGTATVNVTTGAITYTPAAGFTGTDQLVYEVRDADGPDRAPPPHGSPSCPPARSPPPPATATPTRTSRSPVPSARSSVRFWRTGSYVATIDWGDGQASPGTITALSGGGFAVDRLAHLRDGRGFPPDHHGDGLRLQRRDGHAPSCTSPRHRRSNPRRPAQRFSPTPPWCCSAVRAAAATGGWAGRSTLPAEPDTVLVEWGDGKTRRVELAAGETTFDVMHRYTPSQHAGAGVCDGAQQCRRGGHADARADGQRAMGDRPLPSRSG